MRIVHSWLVTKVITFSVPLQLLYMVKHKVLLDKQHSHRCSLSLWAPVDIHIPTTVYREILAANKFGKMARNCLNKYLVILKFGDLHNQIESYDVITRDVYAYSHFGLVTARSQEMETYEVDSCVCGHHVYRGIWNPTYRQGRGQ